MPDLEAVPAERVRGPRRNISISSSVERVTPQKAIRWLEDTEKVAEVRNRSVSEGNVLLFSEAMVRGSWELTHQGIALYKQGDKLVVIDGQHRLWAVVKAGVPVNFVVARYEGGTVGEALEIMASFDRGQKRNLGQVLKITGNVERGSTRAAACRYLLAFLRGGGSGDPRFTRMIDSDILDAVERYQEDLDWFVTLKRRGSFLSAPVAGTLIYAHSIKEHREGVEKFGRQLSGGDGLYEGDPALTFRDWILDKTSDILLRRPEGRMRLMRVAFSALHKAVTGKKAKRFEDSMAGFEFFRKAKEAQR